VTQGLKFKQEKAMKKEVIKTIVFLSLLVIIVAVVSHYGVIIDEMQNVPGSGVHPR